MKVLSSAAAIAGLLMLATAQSDAAPPVKSSPMSSYVHAIVTTGPGANLCGSDTSGSSTVLNNTLANGNPNAVTGDSPVFSGGIVTLSDLESVFDASMIGMSIRITDAPTPQNNGTFVISAVPSLTTVTFANPNGVSEPYSGTWTIGPKAKAPPGILSLFYDDANRCGNALNRWVLTNAQPWQANATALVGGEVFDIVVTAP